MPVILEIANSAPVTPELLFGAMEAVAHLDPEERIRSSARLVAIVNFVEALKLGRDEAAVALAISLRMEALSRLSKNGGLDEFTIAQGDNIALVHQAAIRCAVAERILDGGEGAHFDEGSFQQRLLSIASGSGAAPAV